MPVVSDTAVLGTAIGLVLVFALLSLLCSAATETLSAITERRAHYLLTGLRSMLDRPESTGPGDRAAKQRLHLDVKDAGKAMAALSRVCEQVVDGDAVALPAALPGALPATAEVPSGGPAPAGDAPGPAPESLTLALFGHPLIRSLQTRRVWWRWGSGPVRNPQYISPRQFGRALVDTLVPATVERTDDASLIVRLRTAVTRLDPGVPARRSLLALIEQAEGDVARFTASVEEWYDEQMAPISGWYKRWAKVVLAIAGLVIAIAVNVDTLQVARGLYVDAPVRDAIVAESLNGTLCQHTEGLGPTASCVQDEVSRLRADRLPVWYGAGCTVPMAAKACWTPTARSAFRWYDVPVKLLGWLLTAFAVSFGAPFWFDALSKLGSLRTSGPKPTPTT